MLEARPQAEQTLKRNQLRKWFILGALGCATGGVSLLLLRSLPIATSAAISTVIFIVALKHLALAVMTFSPLGALFQAMKPTVRPYCPWPPDRKDG